MDANFEKQLDRYADLAINVGLNLQPEQRLLIGIPIYNTGVPLEAAPLVRLLVEKAYQKGAKLVDVIWGDDDLVLVRFENAVPDTLDEIPSWQARALLGIAQEGGAFLTVLGNDPDLLKDQDPDLVARHQQSILKSTDPSMEYVRRSAINWSVIAAPTRGWAAKVLPGVSPEKQVASLWDHIFKICRLDQENYLAAWEEHSRQIDARCAYLNEKRYSGLRFTAPGTDIWIGLPSGHIWGSAIMSRQDGLRYIANLPTEEIFTLPDKTKAEGYLRSSIPLSYGGAVIDEFGLTFENGNVVEIQAKRGETILRKLIETDEGSRRLGEIALVPHNSPIAQMDQLFYNILIDENAATHFALGSAYQFCLEGGGSMSDEEFTISGGNRSLVHIDFMIGSEQMDVDGITQDESVEPVMRDGGWAFKV
jgi:aminopeptidase